MRVTIDTSIELDASLSERHSSSVQLTRHPIETGANPADHAREEPDQLVLDGLFTNTPLGANDRAARGPSAPRGAGYADEQIAKLRALKSSRRAVTVRTASRTYQNMVLVKLDEPRDSRTGDAVRFSATFEQVRFVSSQRVRLAIAATPSSIPRKPQKKVGQSKQVPTEAPTMRRSFLKSVGDSFGVTTPGAGVLR